MDFRGFETCKGIFDGRDGVVVASVAGREGAELMTFGEDLETGKEVDAEGYYDAAPGGRVAGCYAKHYPIDADPAPELEGQLVCCILKESESRKALAYRCWPVHPTSVRSSDEEVNEGDNEGSTVAHEMIQPF